MDSEGIKLTNEEKYKRRNKTLYYFNVFIVINIILCAFVLFRGMDDLIPAHYDLVGNITRHGNKIEYLLIPALTLLFLPFSIYFHYRLNKNEQYVKVVFWCQMLMLVIQLTILFFTTWLGFKYTSNIEDNIIVIVTGLSLSLLFTIMFFSHPYFNEKKNVIFGFRTSFTLSNDMAWKKVNSVGSVSGSITMLIAYLITVISFKVWNVYLLGSIFIAFFLTLIYHEIIRKKFKSSLEDTDL